MKAQEFLYNTILELKDIDESDLRPDLSFDDLMLESLDYVEIQIGIKKNFGVDINQALFMQGKLNTLGDLVRYVESNAVGLPA